MSLIKTAAILAKILGYLLILIAFFILFNLFGLPLRHEVGYQVNRVIGQPNNRALSPPDPDFSIVVNKIGAASRIIEGVDPYDSTIYQAALARGVAHARGTALPGQRDNIFLFAHSSADFANATRFNSVFYLMHHLNSGDEITVWYRGVPYQYLVQTKEIVSPNAVKYLQRGSNQETITLMTCWPPGTTLNRLIITAEHLP